MAKEKGEFIKVTKDGEVIEIHPLALADHKRLGWTVVEAEDLAPMDPEAQPEEGKKQSTRAKRASRKKNKASETPAK